MKYALTTVLAIISIACYCQRTVEFTAIKYGLDSLEQHTTVTFSDNSIKIQYNNSTLLLCAENFYINEFIVPVKGNNRFMKHVLILTPKQSDFKLGTTKRFYSLIELCGPNQ